MESSELRIVCVALMAVVLNLGGMETVSCQFAGLDAVQAGTVSDSQPADEPERPTPERFLVIDHGCALLGPDGVEKERLESFSSAAGAISPDGRWVVFNRFEPNPLPGEHQGTLVIQSRVRSKERTTVPLVWGTTGSSFLPLWSSDSKRILVCEQGNNGDGTRGSSYRVYDLAAKPSTELMLPNELWPSDWSTDGTRLLTALRTDDNRVRVAWVNTDDTGKREFITPEQEVAYGAKLSPDGRRILCMVGHTAPMGERSLTRLNVIDLATQKRTVVDKPGDTFGYCWSSDGLKIAYTWQAPLHQPQEVAERTTYLHSCDPDGTNRKVVTSRRFIVSPNSSGRGGVVFFFQVMGWWR